MTNTYKIGLTSFVCVFLIWSFFLASSAFAVSPDKKNASIIRVLDDEGNQVATYRMEEDNPIQSSEAIKKALETLTSLPENDQGRKGTIVVPKGEWKMKEQIILPKGAILKGESENGKTTLVRTLDDFPDNPIEVIDGKKYYEGIIRMNSHTTVKNITLDGKKGNKKANPRQNGIVARGKYTEGGEGNPPDESDYLKDITIEDTIIQNITGDGITLDLVNRLNIQGSTAVTVEKSLMQVKNIGNNGIMGYSIENATIDNVLTQKIGDVNDGGKNYNIALTMQKMNEPPKDGYKLQKKYPVSKNVSVTNSVFIDNPNWEGLDTHSGQNMEFANNIFVGIARPIVIGGQEYSGRYYYPPKDITIANNHINQDEDIKKWKPEFQKQSEVGIAIWGATQNDPIVEEDGTLVTNPTDDRYKENIGYIADTNVKGNKIDQVKPVEKSKNDASMFGGIALKLTKCIMVEKNEIGLAADDSVKRGGIILSSSNSKFKIQENQIGYITKSEEISLDKQKGYAPLEIIGTGNNGSVKENNWKEKNEVGINDEKFGDYSDNSLTDVDSNTCTGKPCNEKGYNYGLSNLKWDVEEGTVTGKTGKNVGSVLLKDGEKKLIEVKVSNEQQFILKDDELIKGDREFQIVAKNFHTNTKYQYEVYKVICNKLLQ